MQSGMAKTLTWLTLVALCGLGAGSAQAGTLFSANLQLVIAGFPPASFTASGLAGAGSASGTGATAAWSVAAGAVPSGASTAFSLTTVAPPFTQLQVVVGGNPGAGAFAASSPGSMPVTGIANLRCCGGITLLGVPVSVGAPATIVPPATAGVGVTAYANAWTTKTTSIALATTGGTVLTVMGANGLAGGVGTVVLVTALNVLTNVAGQVPTFAILTLNYVPDLPEPGTLAWLGAGAAGLLHVGRRKQRTRR